MKYTEELLDIKWKRKRAGILQRDGFKCTVCGSDIKLTVHHTYYERGKKAWQYPNKSLLTLCDKCHYDFHCTNEVPIRGKNQHKEHSKKQRIKKMKHNAIESKDPRYRKKVNGEWKIFSKTDFRHVFSHFDCRDLQ
jgi:hypothetical protein